MNIFLLVAGFSALFVPTLSFAAAGDDIFTLQGTILAFLSQLTELFWLVSIAFFIYGVAKFIRNSEDSKEREQAKSFMVWSIISFTVLVTLWGIVAFFGDTLDIDMGGQLELGDKDGDVIDP